VDSTTHMQRKIDYHKSTSKPALIDRLALLIGTSASDSDSHQHDFAISYLDYAIDRLLGCVTESDVMTYNIKHGDDDLESACDLPIRREDGDTLHITLRPLACRRQRPRAPPCHYH
jgi:hypothetical protein